MAEGLVKFFLKVFSGITTTELGKTITVFVVSLLPLIELRGGLIAAALLNLNFFKAFIFLFLTSFISNFFPNKAFNSITLCQFLATISISLTYNIRKINEPYQGT